VYKFIVGPGHAWLKVPLSEIEGMTFSRFSFRDRDFAYLEEDIDAFKFIKAKGLSFEDIEEVTVDHFDRPRRSLS